MVYPFPGAEEKEYMKLLFATYVYSKYKTHKFMPDLSLSSYFSQKKPSQAIVTKRSTWCTHTSRSFLLERKEYENHFGHMYPAPGRRCYWLKFARIMRMPLLFQQGNLMQIWSLTSLARTLRRQCTNLVWFNQGQLYIHWI